jgi:diaminohydroxyphosphoribosylaminopyrimidine deaminase/5-amino-6-(5-phosphoribosylamino)uracil reductase
MLHPQDFMRRALELAERGAGWTSPNPMVGAVVVKQNIIISEGWHEQFGGPHAEFIALQQAGVLAHGAELYLTLEPCCAGPGKRNPPCVDEIICAGIRTVYLSLRDPDPRVDGQGIKRLRQANIEVIEGILEKPARKLNEIYLKFKTTGTPFITLKMAMTADGKIATCTGDSQWISSPESLRLAHELRHRHRAILVGIGTVLADNPQLTVRLEKKTRDPIRIILDSHGRIPLDATVVRSAGQTKTILATTKALTAEREQVLKQAHLDIWRLPARQGRVDPHALIRRLAEEKIDSVLIEGGAGVAWSFLNEKLIDKILFVIAPKIVGGREAPGPVGGVGVQKLSDSLLLKNVSVSHLNGDILYEAYLGESFDKD